MGSSTPTVWSGHSTGFQQRTVTWNLAASHLAANHPSACWRLRITKANRLMSSVKSWFLLKYVHVASPISRGNNQRQTALRNFVCSRIFSISCVHTKRPSSQYFFLHSVVEKIVRQDHKDTLTTPPWKRSDSLEEHWAKIMHAICSYCSKSINRW